MPKTVYEAEMTSIEQRLRAQVDHGEGPVVVRREDLQALLVVADDARKLAADFTHREVARSMRAALDRRKGN